MMDKTLSQNMDNTSVPNSTFTIAGVSHPAGHPQLMVTENLYLRMSILDGKPAYRKSAKH